MATCKSCNNNILSQTLSLIGDTNCNQPCPPEIVCEDIIGSNCVFYSGPTVTCPSTQTNIVTNGQTMSEVIQSLATQICNSGTPCFEWEDVTAEQFNISGSFPNTGLYPNDETTIPWESGTNPFNPLEIQTVKYTKDPIACKAGFQGSCTHKIVFEQGDLVTNPTRKTFCLSKLFSIPSNIWPSKVRSIPTIIFIQPSVDDWYDVLPMQIEGVIYVFTNGEVYVNFDDFSPWDVLTGSCESCPSGATLQPYWYVAGNTPPYLIAKVNLDGIYYDL